MTFVTDEELKRWPILHFDHEDLSRLGRALYTRAAAGAEVDVREQLDEIYESGLQAGADLADADRMEAFNDGLAQGLAEGKKKT